jgi:hypothetical protein
MQNPDLEARRRASKKLFAIIGFVAGVITVILVVRLLR